MIHTVTKLSAGDFPLNTLIHPTAVIHPSAKLDPKVKVGPYAVIGANVEMHEIPRFKSKRETKCH